MGTIWFKCAVMIFRAVERSRSPFWPGGEILLEIVRCSGGIKLFRAEFELKAFVVRELLGDDDNDGDGDVELRSPES